MNQVKNSSDIRVLKTKKKLYDTFFELTSEMPLDDISVNLLCERADVRRATFYRHFVDKMNFCEFILKRQTEEFELDHPYDTEMLSYPCNYCVDLASKMVDFIDMNEQIVNNLLRSNSLTSLVEVVLKSHFLNTYEKLLSKSKCSVNPIKLIASPESVALTVVCSVMGITVHWIATDKAKPKQTLVEEISKVLTRLLYTEDYVG